MATPSAPPQVVTVPADFAVQSGLHKLSEEQKKRAIYVTGISKNASVKNLSDFFSFCGDLERIVQHTDPTNIDRQVAVVVFDDPGSASTAVLLAGAIVVDQPIEIFPFALNEEEFAQRGIAIEAAPSTTTAAATGESGASSSSNAEAGDSVPPSAGAASASQPPKALAVIASLAAAGYVKGETLLAEMKKKAIELDASMHVSDTASQAYNTTTKKIHDFDEDVRLSERVTRIKDTISTSTSEGFRSLDEKYELKSKADAVKDKAKELTNKAYEYTAIKTSVDYLTYGWNSVMGAWNSLRSETASEISKQRGIHSMTSSPRSDSASPSDAAAAAADDSEDNASSAVSTAATAGSAPPDSDNVTTSSHNEPHQNTEPSAPPVSSSSSKDVLLEFGEEQAGSSEPQVLYPDT